MKITKIGGRLHKKVFCGAFMGPIADYIKDSIEMLINFLNNIFSLQTALCILNSKSI